MSEISAVLEAAVANITDNAWVSTVGQKGRQNVMADGVDTGYNVFIDIPIPFEMSIVSGGRIYETYSPTMVFAITEKFDELESLRRTHVGIIMTSVRQFIQRLIDESDVYMVSEINGFDAYEVFDANMTCVIIQFNVRLDNGEPIC